MFFVPCSIRRASDDLKLEDLIDIPQDGGTDGPNAAGVPKRVRWSGGVRMDKEVRCVCLALQKGNLYTRVYELYSINKE